MRLLRHSTSGPAVLLAGVLLVTAALTIVLAVGPIGTPLGPAAARAQTAPAVLGTLTLTPAAGTNLTIVTARTSAGCSAAGSDGYDLRVVGPNGFDYPVTTRGTFGFDAAAPFDVAFEQTMQDASVLQSPAVPLVAGTYSVTLNCNDAFGISYGTFTGALTFTDPTAYTAEGGPPAPPEVPIPSTPPSTSPTTIPTPTVPATSTDPTSAPTSTATSTPETTAELPAATPTEAAPVPVSSDGTGTGGTGTGGGLAYTGAPVGLLLSAGLALCVAGVGMMASARARRVG